MPLFDEFQNQVSQEKFDFSPGLPSSGIPLQSSSMNWGEGFANSLGSSFTELVGAKATKETQRWRDENPMGSIASQVMGYAVPGTAYLKGLKALGRAKNLGAIAKGAQKLSRPVAKGDLATKPFAATMGREIVRWAPFELARPVIGSVLGEALAEEKGTSYEGTPTMMMKAGFDLALGGLITGTFAKVKSAGELQVSPSSRPGANLNAPKQIQIRDMLEARKAGQVTEEGLKQQRAAINNLEVDIMNEMPPKGRAVHGLRNETADVARKRGSATKKLNAHFQNITHGKLGPGGEIRERTKTIVRKLLSHNTSSGFATKKARDNYLAKAGLEPDWQQFMQYPRRITFPKIKDNSEFGRWNKLLRENFEQVDTDRGIHLTRDSKDGLFVIAKQVDAHDFMLFKTDRPDVFAASRNEWTTEQIKKAAWLADKPMQKTGVKAVDEALSLSNLPAFDFSGIKRTTKGAAQRAAQAMAQRIPGVSDSELRRRTALMFNKYVSPAMFQFRDNPIAARIFASARSAQDLGQAQALERFFGRRVPGQSRSVWKQIFASESTQGNKAPDDLINALYKGSLDGNPTEEVAAFWRTVNAEASVQEGVEKYGLGENGAALLKKLDEIDGLNRKDVSMVEDAIGESGKTKFLENHYGINHTWEGEIRVPIFEGAGDRTRLVGVIGGNNNAAAIQAAKDFQAEALVRAQESGNKILIDATGSWRIGKATAGDFKTDSALRKLLPKKGSRNEIFDQIKNEKISSQVHGPKTLTRERHQIPGFKEIMSAKELKNTLLKNYQSTQGYVADKGVMKVFERDIEALGDSNYGNIEVARQLQDRLGQLRGEKGEIDKALNKAADTVFSPILGANSASKIVAATNGAIHMLTLGFFNASYAAANALTFIQNAIPHIAYITHAAPEDVSKYYNWHPVMDTAGKVNGVGALSMMKLVGKSFREMGKPDAHLMAQFERAGAEGVWDPKFIEEFVGENASKLSNMRATLKQEGGWPDFIKAVGQFLPSASEKFSRGHSFVLGHIVGRDIFKFKPGSEQLYRFAREFTEKTQFNYSAADRARVMTGPAGSAFGLFKNWAMHYMGWMAEYAGQAQKGNWRPLMWQTGGTAAMGGAGGLPFIEWAGENTAQWLGDDSLQNVIYDRFDGGPDGSALADTVYYGLPSMLGFSLQNQMASPFADPGEDAARLFGFVYWDRMKAAGRLVGDVTNTLDVTGRNPITDRSTVDALTKAFAPKFMHRANMAIGNDYIRGFSSGKPMVQDVSLARRAAYIVGLNPLQVERAMDVGNKLWKDEKARKEAISAFGQRWAAAVMEGDWSTAQQILATAAVQGTPDISSVVRSGKSHIARFQGDNVADKFSPEAIMEARQRGLLGRKD